MTKIPPNLKKMTKILLKLKKKKKLIVNYYSNLFFLETNKHTHTHTHKGERMKF